MLTVSTQHPVLFVYSSSRHRLHLLNKHLIINTNCWLVLKTWTFKCSTVKRKSEFKQTETNQDAKFDSVTTITKLNRHWFLSISRFPAVFRFFWNFMSERTLYKILHMDKHPQMLIWPDTWKPVNIIENLVLNTLHYNEVLKNSTINSSIKMTQPSFCFNFQPFLMITLPKRQCPLSPGLK